MSHTLIVRREAESDLTAAYDWYESQREGLGPESLLCVEAVLEAIRTGPRRLSQAAGAAAVCFGPPCCWQLPRTCMPGLECPMRRSPVNRLVHLVSKRASPT